MRVAAALVCIATLAVLATGPSHAGDVDPRQIVQMIRDDPEKVALRRELAVARRKMTRYRLGWLKRGRTIKVMDKRIANMDRVARHGIDYPRLIRLAATAYSVDAAMLERKARCESANFTDFYNETPIYNGEHATGVMQFIPSTWRSTPYAGFDIYDPFANVLAGAWMHARGRGGEWACR